MNDPAVLEALKEKGNDYFKEKKFTEAISVWNQGLLLSPASIILKNNKALAQIEMKDNQSAIATLVEALESGTDAPQEHRVKAYRRLGLAKENFRDIVGAIASFRDAQSLVFDDVIEMKIKHLLFESTSSQSLQAQLVHDPQEAQYRPNKVSREVLSGHYVLVQPTKLPFPKLLEFSSDVATMLGLDEAYVKSDYFLRFFSGDPSVICDRGVFSPWATPYALTIYGQEMIDNCPFGTGNGYGDGRAISIAEVLVPETNMRLECQLKGAGTTPFCRGGDGRAVLRSSMREFLASEAMHFLRVSTTRALSLVVSQR